MNRPQTIPSRLVPWVEARSRFGLTDVQVQMARELALNPRKLADRLARDRAFPGQSVAEWIEQKYRGRFRREAPELARSIEEQTSVLRARKSARQVRRKERKAGKPTTEAVVTADSAQRKSLSKPPAPPK